MTLKHYFSWLGLNLQLKSPVTDRITHLKEIITFYCSIKVVIMQKYTNQKEEDTATDTWQGYEVKLKYLPKIEKRNQNTF